MIFRASISQIVILADFGWRISQFFRWNSWAIDNSIMGCYARSGGDETSHRMERRGMAWYFSAAKNHPQMWMTLGFSQHFSFFHFSSRSSIWTSRDVWYSGAGPDDQNKGATVALLGRWRWWGGSIPWVAGRQVISRKTGNCEGLSMLRRMVYPIISH